VHVVTLLTTIEAGAQTTVVLVVLGFTVTVAVLEMLVAWIESPP